MFPAEVIQAAGVLSARLRAGQMSLATAESCTGGLIAALMTEFPGSSTVFERGYVTYSNAAKSDCLGVPSSMIAEHGAVSVEVARAMASGALARSGASISIAVTGVAGPDGGTPAKPVGLVHIASAHADRLTARECRFGAVGRDAIRQATVMSALALVTDMLNV